MSSYIVSKYADALYEMSQKDRGPFPYEDCRQILREAGTDVYDDLIPDLSSYFYDIYSHSAGAKNLVSWSDIELTRSQKAFRKSFFDRHPKYSPLEPAINLNNASTLAQRMKLYDQLRHNLIKFTSILMEDRKSLNASQQRKQLEVHH